MKLRSDRKAQNSAKASNENTTFTSDNNDQWVKDNLQTIEVKFPFKILLKIFIFFISIFLFFSFVYRKCINFVCS